MYKKFNFMFTKYQRSKEIVVYLPDDYEESKKRYPVLYINDGQNAFFDEDAYLGISWGFGDYAKLHQLDIIMVAIPCVFDDIGRMNEYGPWIIDSKIAYQETGKEDIIVGGEGDDYIQWIINELKPYIDTHYPTLKNENAMIGSSMGGIITAYAVIAYPEIFSKGAAISTAFFLYMKEFQKLIEQRDLSSLKAFYFDCGSEEGCGNKKVDSLYMTSNDLIYYLLARKSKRIEYRFFKNATHSEAQWRKRMPIYMRYLFAEEHNV